jgi:hypothetical protein
LGRDPLEPVLACPVFEQSMWEPLRNLSQEWLLPGLDKVANNTALLLKVNAPFVEAYLVGLNHEMARELLWREFPTDQRGTTFRRFWPALDRVPGGGDIREIDTWARNAPLGSNAPPGSVEPLVLVVRGDLLRRYPNVSFYAAREVTSGSTSVFQDEQAPIFLGSLGSDVTFVGFTVLESDVMDAARGWRFILQQPAGEPRFCLSDTFRLAALSDTTRGLSIYLDVTAEPVRSMLSAATGEYSSAEVAVALSDHLTRVVFDARDLLVSGGAS